MNLLFLLCTALVTLRATTASDPTIAGVEELISNIEVFGEDGEVVLEKTYEPKVTKAFALKEVEDFISERLELVTDVELTEVDEDAFLLQIGGIQGEEVEDGVVQTRYYRLGYGRYYGYRYGRNYGYRYGIYMY